jgi:hypothetical protein
MAKLERRQRLLARIVDIGSELTAMAAACARARTLASGPARDGKALEFADVFCRGARRRVAELFRGVGDNDDLRTWKLAQSVVAGDHAWLERGILDFHDLHAAVRSAEEDAAVPRDRPQPATTAH